MKRRDFITLLGAAPAHRFLSAAAPATASSGLSRWSARAHYFGRGGKRNREPGGLRSPEVVYLQSYLVNQR